MNVKIIQFKDCRAILTDKKVDIPDVICIFSKNIDMLPKEPLLEFECYEKVFSDNCHNRSLFKKVIDLYMIKEISMQTLFELRTKIKNK